MQPDVDLDGARLLERLSGATIETRVRTTVSGVYDWIYDGHGNWPFNTAFAATEGMEAKVARFTSMNDVEDWVAAGVPVIFSFAWKKGAITGSAVSSSDGHLAVIVGFDGAGNPIVNDPAAPTNEEVQRTYNRAELETVMPAELGRDGLPDPPARPRGAGAARARRSRVGATLSRKRRSWETTTAVPS